MSNTEVLFVGLIAAAVIVYVLQKDDEKPPQIMVDNMEMDEYGGEQERLAEIGKRQEEFNVAVLSVKNQIESAISQTNKFRAYIERSFTERKQRGDVLLSELMKGDLEKYYTNVREVYNNMTNVLRNQPRVAEEALKLLKLTPKSVLKQINDELEKIQDVFRENKIKEYKFEFMMKAHAMKMALEAAPIQQHNTQWNQMYVQQDHMHEHQNTFNSNRTMNVLNAPPQDHGGQGFNVGMMQPPTDPARNPVSFIGRDSAHAPRMIAASQVGEGSGPPGGYPRSDNFNVGSLQQNLPGSLVPVDDSGNPQYPPSNFSAAPPRPNRRRV